VLALFKSLIRRARGPEVEHAAEPPAGDIIEAGDVLVDAEVVLLRLGLPRELAA
jgi:hypothetical protein